MLLLRAPGGGVHRATAGGGFDDAKLVEWFDALADRLRRVRITCGDWQRLTTPAVLFPRKGANSVTAVFLDPPYVLAGRSALYTHETDVALAVRDWAIARGDDPRLRIALCGYQSDFEMPVGWTEVAWKAQGGYGSGRNGRGEANRHRERIWFSPGCLPG